MARVRVVDFVSLDGVIQGPLSADEDRDGGFEHGGWVPPLADATVNASMQEATVAAAGMLLGRRTYETFRATWSEADQGEPAVAAMNRMPKYVVTRSRDELPPWGTTERIAELPGGVAALKARIVGDLVVFGSGELVRGLARHDLVDEYRLLVFPVVLGGGKRMFGEGGTLTRFTLTASETSPNGVLVLTYARTSE